MKQKYLLSGIIVSIGITAAIILVANVFAQVPSAPAVSTANVKFPVPELGNCQNETDCRAFCDKPANTPACLDFASKNNLMPAEEVAAAKKFLAAGSGPGGCTSKDSCETYCNDVAHINECVAFAEKAGILSPQDLAEAKKVQAALAQGFTPPGNCKNKKDCDNYCSDPSHMEECVTFAEKAGFMPANEVADAHKMLAAIKKGAKPPPCRGKAECDAYCGEPANFDQCISFAEAAGFMTPDEAAMAKKTGGKGPGDCKSKEECDAFCQNPANQETCFNFAKDHGLISQADLQKMEDGKQQMMQGLNQAPPQVLDCLKSAVGEGVLEKIKAGTGMPSREVGAAMQSCFEKNMDQMAPPNGPAAGNSPSSGAEFSGPGGCNSPEECMKFCQNNPEACKNFQRGAGMPPGDLGPGSQMPKGAFEPQENMRLPENGVSGSGPTPNMMPPQNLLPGKELNPSQPPMPPGNLPSSGGPGINTMTPSAEQIQQMMQQQSIQPFQPAPPPTQSAPPPGSGNLWQAVKDFFSK